MLYDKRWEEKKPDTPVAGLIAWLETKDPDQRYDYGNPNKCLVAQYLKQSGASDWNLSSLELRDMFGAEAHWVIRGSVTFGQVLKRLKAIGS